MNAPDKASKSAILEDLRGSTRDEHQALEDKLALMRLPASKEHFIGVLKGFLGFHLVFEDVVAARPDFAEFVSQRRRVPHLRRDLLALGVDEAGLEAVPRCEAAAKLCAGAAECWGALYVIEGSTLGGQVISRALEGTAWLPEGGLRTFYPYGAQTGRMWNAFREEITRASADLDRRAIVSGAGAAFRTLREWSPAA